MSGQRIHGCVSYIGCSDSNCLVPNLLATQCTVTEQAGRGDQGCTFPYSLVTVPGSGLGLIAMPAEKVGTLLLLGTTLTVGDTLMKMGEAATLVGEAFKPAGRHISAFRLH